MPKIPQVKWFYFILVKKLQPSNHKLFHNVSWEKLFHHISKNEWIEFDLRDPLGELPGSQVFCR